MNSMCIACGSQLPNGKNEPSCTTCLKMSYHNGEKAENFNDPHVEFGEQYESNSDNETSPFLTPLLSPFSSSEASLNFGDSKLFEDLGSRMNTFYSQHGQGRSEEHLKKFRNGTSTLKLNIEQSRDNVERGGSVPYTTQENDTSSSSLASGRRPIREIDIENFQDNNDGSGSPVGLEKKLSLSSLTVDSDDSSNEEKKRLTNQNLVDDPLKNSDHSVPNTFNFYKPPLPNFEDNPLIWKLPEPENLADDTDNSFAYKYEDDDDDYGDGAKWSRPCSLCTEELEHFDCSEEERQKAMLGAMNGQLKILVSRFLATEGISILTEGNCENWLDIVTSLSWKAALLIKPEATEGRGMDPSSYVKIKCIASGKPHESQVIKGLVFKKNTAHKHMPTNFRNPKLLLLEGALGQSAAGLSSFDSMDQENNHLRSFTEMIETCHPNVVLVEKTVSRDIQESLVEKGITLIFEMKRHRLERIARCIGSPIISNITTKLTLKQCESFHIEKFVEEHNGCPEGSKRPSKTLMFLEGFVNPLGCTILLKGANSDELKKIKRILHYTVFAAYHLKLETSFFADQFAFFSDKDSASSLCAKSLLSVTVDDISSNLASMQDSFSSDTAATMLEVPVSVCNGSAKGLSHGGVPNSVMKPEDSLEFPGCKPTINLTRDKSKQSDLVLDKSHIGNILQADSSGFKFSSPDFGFNSRKGHHKLLSEEFCIGSDTSCEGGVKKSHDETFICEEAVQKQDATDKDEVQGTLDPQSILVLKSSQCITKQTFCVQCHLSRIKYYGNFDISLGRLLKDEVLNKEHICSSCGEPTEAHVYSYTHQNGNLSVFVKRLPEGETLSGENEGKLWMWTRCLRCELESGIPRSTRRVVLSSSARKLSFGKFLELSFSGHSSASKLSKCGHSLLRDCLRFFGLGSKVAMFKYSPVEIYAACKPPPVLHFENPKKQAWLKNEVESVLAKGHAFFSEVSNTLLKLKFVLSKHKITISGSVIDFFALEEMLEQEKAEFENALLKATDGDEQKGLTVYEILGLRWLTQELLLGLYVWDRRLHCLLHSGEFNMDDSCLHWNEVSGNTDSKRTMNDSLDEPTSSADNHSTQDMQTDLDTETAASACIEKKQHNPSDIFELEIPVQFSNGSSVQKNVVNLVDQCAVAELQDFGESNKTAESGGDTISDNLVPVMRTEFLENADNLEVKIGQAVSAAEKSEESKYIHTSSVEDKSLAMAQDPQTLIWAPFSELRKEFKKDLFGGSLQKFGFIDSYTPSHLSPISLGGPLDLLHFTFGPGGNILTACEDEISSIIASALAISEDRQGLFGTNEDEFVEAKAVMHKSSHSLSSDPFISPAWSFTDSEKFNLLNSASASFDELSSLSYDGSFSGDQLLASHKLHPEIPIGTSKITGKSRCSVICIHAKQFYSLRRKCCPSELAYISSLSRCKKWDAQGGKSKALFAKTLDDRFIIKQIKKTELDSFLKFASEYFKHVSHSLDSGSQTCLAKILGIYQVRQIKNGKEVTIDLMVMENLMFGHNLSRTYDLKGAVFSRYIPDSNGSKKVLLDQNFIEDMRVSPIYIGGKTKHLLQRAIWNDTSFLNNINVMDYSLLVGVDKDRHELVFGIIDYLRQYTWDKQLETWVKTSIVVPKNELPTIISPKEYKKRFRKFMTKYFLTVPDSWECDRCAFPCKFCRSDMSGTAKVHNAELPEQQTEECK